METTVKVKHLKQSPTKVRFVLNELRGLKVDNAINMLTNSNKKASVFILKALKSGLSNLENTNNDFDQSNLFISEAFVDGGPTMKRFRPRAMGRASQILKRTSHLTITLSERG
jgi:large subunit ribosomal protein L22